MDPISELNEKCLKIYKSPPRYFISKVDEQLFTGSCLLPNGQVIHLLSHECFSNKKTVEEKLSTQALNDLNKNEKEYRRTNK